MVADVDIELVLSTGWLLLVMWLILRAFRQRHVLAKVVVSAALDDGVAGEVAVIVPARDEGSNIGPCLQSLLAQDYPSDHLRIIVVDDDSTDNTADIATALARADRRITLLRAPTLPTGWYGKVHACWIGAAAVPADIRWLCFIDADMRAEPPLIASAVKAADAGEIDLLSLAPRHELRSFAERLMIPCGLYLLAISQDLARVQSPKSADALATGQFMLVRRDAYKAIGGHAAVRGEICEDVQLARLLKQSGRRVLLRDGSQLLSTRMYTGWKTLWPGITKNLTDMLRGPLPTIVTALAAVAIAWAAVLLPPLDALGCVNGSRAACLALAPAVTGSAMAFGLHVAGAAYFGIPFWYGFLFPLGYTAGAIMAFDSLRWRLVHRVHWKGRVYS